METIPLQEYINNYKLDQDLIWKDASKEQIIFVRDRIVNLVGAGLSYDARQMMATVISTHTSKSCELPVYKITRPDGLTVVLRNNFHDWKMSVISEEPIEGDNYKYLFHTTSPIEPDYTGNELSSVYFEGFPSKYIFGYLDEGDGKAWSACIGGNYDLWTAIWLMMNDLGHLKAHTWHTRESHAAELKAGKY